MKFELKQEKINHVDDILFELANDEQYLNYLKEELNEFNRIRTTEEGKFKYKNNTIEIKIIDNNNSISFIIGSTVNNNFETFFERTETKDMKNHINLMTNYFIPKLKLGIMVLDLNEIILINREYDREIYKLTCSLKKEYGILNIANKYIEEDNIEFSIDEYKKKYNIQEVETFQTSIFNLRK